MIRRRGLIDCQRCYSLALSKRALPRHHFIQPENCIKPQTRCMHYTPPVRAAPPTADRGPPSEEDTQTDFTAMNILANTPPPTTAIDACLDDGFALNSGLKITGGGVILFGGEAFKWRPWIRQRTGGSNSAATQNSVVRLQNAKGQWEVDGDVWGVLDLSWPKPDLLIVGTGRSILPLSPATRQRINELGIRIEVQDTRNAAAQFNLLATERGVQQVAAALIPIGPMRS